MSRTTILILSLLAVANVQSQRLDNYHIYSVIATNQDQFAALKHLEGSTEDINFLEEGFAINHQLHMIVSPAMLNKFLQTLSNHGIDYKLLEKDAQSKVRDNDVAESPISPSDYDWKLYYKLEDTYNWLKSLVERYPKQVQLIEAGKSYEGRQILGIKISYKEGNKGIFIEGGIHAREWISPATVTYMTNQLLTSEDSDVRFIAENFDWYIVPHANPDGYVYSHTTNRLWRKTRTPYGECHGADPNRNWDFHWSEVHSYNDTCAGEYIGPNAFSEIEIRTLSQYIATLKGKLLMYLSYHSFSQFLLFPYAYTSELPDNYDDLKRICDIGVKAIGRRYGTIYDGGSMNNVLYPCSGTSMDWVYGTVGIKLVFTIELRPLQSYMGGFELPPKHIVPTGKETLDALVAMVKEASTLR